MVQSRKCNARIEQKKRFEARAIELSCCDGIEVWCVEGRVRGTEGASDNRTHAAAGRQFRRAPVAKGQ